MKQGAVFCWSGGKDSALALHRIRHDPRYDVVALLTTCNERYKRVSMHGVRVELARKQADSIGLPLDVVSLSPQSSNDEYERKMSQYLLERRSEGIEAVIFGDIFLEDLRAWREARLAQIGMRGVFPLWKHDTHSLVEEFVGLGFASIVCCVNDAYLDESWLGRTIDGDFVRRLPANVDPCGENGEFHSFSFRGPIFKEPIPVHAGETIYRPIERTSLGAAACSLPGPSETKGFWFCELLEERARRATAASKGAS